MRNQNIDQKKHALKALQEGKCVVLHGPAGCGKTTFAKSLAHKTHTFVNASELGNLFQPYLDVDLVIIAGTPNQEWLRTMLGSNTIIVREKGLAPRRISTPKIIIETSMVSLPSFITNPDNRRFHVIAEWVL